jgi:hypothetical protein
MTLNIGDKVKIKPNADGFNSTIFDLDLEGTIIYWSDGGYTNVKVSFELTKDQYRILSREWGSGTKSSPEHYTNGTSTHRSWVFRKVDLVLSKRYFTDEERKTFEELKSKPNRSPVEDFILFGLEE